MNTLFKIVGVQVAIVIAPMMAYTFLIAAGITYVVLFDTVSFDTRVMLFIFGLVSVLATLVFFGLEYTIYCLFIRHMKFIEIGLSVAVFMLLSGMLMRYMS